MEEVNRNQLSTVFSKSTEGQVANPGGSHKTQAEELQN